VPLAPFSGHSVLLSTKIKYQCKKGHHLAVFHEVGVQIKESLGIISENVQKWRMLLKKE
jgi:hypothetical protein